MRISDWSSDVCSSDLFRFLAFEEPASSGQIQRILAIPGKLTEKREVDFLSRPEIDAVLAAPDRTCWLGRRDHMLLLFAIQTGLRLSEIASLDRSAITLGTGAHRSEEHTSELQSLMRILYDVFCLKKKKIKPQKRSILIKH